MYINIHIFNPYNNLVRYLLLWNKDAGRLYNLPEFTQLLSDGVEFKLKVLINVLYLLHPAQVGQEGDTNWISEDGIP